MSNFDPTTILDTPVVLGTAEGTGEVQKIDYSGVTAGKTTTLTFEGETTAALPAKAGLTAAEIQAKLRALSTIPDDGVTVTGETGGPYTVVFNPESFTNDNVPLIESAAAEGTAPVVTVVSTGVSPEGPPAVVKGTGQADRTGDVSPLTGESPAKRREGHGAEFGD